MGKFNQARIVHIISGEDPDLGSQPKGQDHYIILKHLRVRLKSIIPNVRQTNVFISYNQNIILGKHIEPSLGVLTRNLNKLIFW